MFKKWLSRAASSADAGMPAATSSVDLPRAAAGSPEGSRRTPVKRGRAGLGPTGHVDTFARDNLPPQRQMPEFRFDLPELKYPARMNCATWPACLTAPKMVARPRPVPRPLGLVVKKGSNRCCFTSELIP